MLRVYSVVPLELPDPQNWLILRISEAAVFIVNILVKSNQHIERHTKSRYTTLNFHKVNTSVCKEH